MIYTAKDFTSILKSKKCKKYKRGIIAAMMAKIRMEVRSLKVRWRRKMRVPRHRHRNRGFAVEEFTEIKLHEPATFERMFRMDGASFDELVELLEPMIARDESQATYASGSPISTTTRLAVTMRWLSGGSYIDLCFAWGVAKSTFYSERGVVWPTIEALDQLLKLGLPITNIEALQE
jgi:hypothetical protein